MPKILKFVIFGKPVPWARARRNGKRYFTAPAQARSMKEIALAALAAAKGLHFDGPVELSCKFRYPRPKSDKKKLKTYVTGRPDLDNLVKQIKDALNGVIWKDDSFVVRYRDIDKQYCDGRAHTLVEITEVET